eukprot:SAG31_NODE_2786_length_5092_cov_3.254556_4_plen_131_part_00
MGCLPAGNATSTASHHRSPELCGHRAANACRTLMWAAPPLPSWRVLEGGFGSKCRVQCSARDRLRREWLCHAPVAQRRQRRQQIPPADRVVPILNLAKFSGRRSLGCTSWLAGCKYGPVRYNILKYALDT